MLPFVKSFPALVADNFSPNFDWIGRDLFAGGERFAIDLNTHFDRVDRLDDCGAREDANRAETKLPSLEQRVCDFSSLSE